MFSNAPSFWRDRVAASAIHLGLSVAIALLAALLVFGIWYPYPYRETSGGRELFLLLVTVDVILGPLVTLAIFNRSKQWRVLRRDLAFVAAIQSVALLYGLFTVFVARPVYLVFEYGRFGVVHAVDVSEDVGPLPLWGPNLLSLRPFRSSREKSDAEFAALAGQNLASRQELWQPYEKAANEILKEAKPAVALISRFPGHAKEIRETLASVGRSVETAVYLPMADRKSFWTVLLDPVSAQVLTFVPLDPF